MKNPIRNKQTRNNQPKKNPPMQEEREKCRGSRAANTDEKMKSECS